MSPGDDPGRVYQGAVALFRGADGGAGGGLSTLGSSSLVSSSEKESDDSSVIVGAPRCDTPLAAVMVLPLDLKAWRAGSMFVM